MARIYRVRRQRLLSAASEQFEPRGMQKNLADLLGREPNYISRLLSDPRKSGHKRIGEELARLAEEKFGKPVYWLDGYDGPPSGDVDRTASDSAPSAYPMDAEVIELILGFIRDECDALGVEWPTPDVIAATLIEAYPDAVAEKQLSAKRQTLIKSALHKAAAHGDIVGSTQPRTHKTNRE